MKTMGAKEYMTMMSDYTKCTYGSMKNQINMHEDHGVLSRKTGKAVLNANDHKWQENILGYGMCSAFCDDNNKYTQMINRAQQNGNRFVRPRIKCPCRARTEEAWRDGDKHFVIEGAPVLTKESTLECMWGGVISFCEPPKPGDDDAPQTVMEDVIGKVKKACEPLNNLSKEIEKTTNKITDNSLLKTVSNNLKKIGVNVKNGVFLSPSETQKIEITERGKKITAKNSKSISIYKTPTVSVDNRIGSVHIKGEINARIATVTFDQANRLVKIDKIKVGCSGGVSIEDGTLHEGISIDKDGPKGEISKK